MEDVIEAQRGREPIYFAASRRTFGGFYSFLRDRGVAGLAIGFILGGAAQRLVQALMDDIVNPLLGFFGGVRTISEYAVGQFKIGDFASVVLNFIILAFIVYVFFKALRLEKLDKPKG